ncbi:unnamed protein product [Oppiella nova]|uniref:C2H2-type domain-containing protein n=1 Tax=Oppiella nova TaxID=334625 RepID=A0A7R9QN60_9ACAR|nr:unnamed protein product [Oppiella nova]CAG2168624.1 unnamed protein product [Oppiella nova]
MKTRLMDTTHEESVHNTRRSDKQLNAKKVKKNVTKDAMSGRLFKCSVNGCLQRLSNKQDVIRHELRLHPNDFPNIPWIRCRYTGCQYRTKFNTDMNWHKKIHSNSYECQHTGCQFKTKYKPSFKRHIQTYNHKKLPKLSRDGKGSQKAIESQIKCSVKGCYQRFQSKGYLTQHELRQHSDAFPDVPWIECQRKGCQFRCKLTDDMTVHKKMHTNPGKVVTRRCRSTEITELTDRQLDSDLNREYIDNTIVNVKHESIDGNIIEPNVNSNFKLMTDLLLTQTKQEDI